MISLYPLRFRPLLKRYLWGGRRLGEELGKSIGVESDYAESWEVCDLGVDQTQVAAGPLVGLTLHELVVRYGEGLLGRQAPRPQFPLLVKFLDAASRLSVQVHPNDAQAERLNPPELGKTEAWVVLAAAPGSTLCAGLREGVDRTAFEQALAAGHCEECLHFIEPAVGDCLLLPAGTVHSLGAGLLVAEIQQSSDRTYRLYDYNRIAPDGKPRTLHLGPGLAAVNFAQGPVRVQRPQPLAAVGLERLAACEQFVLDRWRLSKPAVMATHGAFRILTMLSGSMSVEGDAGERPLARGDTLLLPAALPRVGLTPREPTTFLVAALP